MRGRPILVAAAAALIVGLAGGAATDVGPWYQSLQKPSWTPPNWAFAPAWTAIYALCVAAGVTAWTDARQSADRAWVVSLFFFNAVLNIIWSFVFFTLRRPDWALAEVTILWVSIAAMIVAFRLFSPRASLLLAPYLAWVTFAAALNYAVVALNAPFA